MSDALDAERLMLERCKRHFEQQLKALQEEEKRLLAWRPGDPVPSTDPNARIHSGDERSPTEPEASDSEQDSTILALQERLLSHLGEDSPWLMEHAPPVLADGARAVG